MMAFLKTYKAYFSIALLWLIVVLVVNPIGDFPLNDDWCYGKSVKTLQENGYLKLYNWGEMTLVGQVYYGYLFTKVFGFSFTVLRCSTLVLALLSFFGILKIFNVIGLSKQLSKVGLLLCMFNPIFLELSFTFMTDIPFYTITIYVCYFFIKHIKTQQTKYLIFAFLCAIVAYSIRQLAIVFPLVWCVFELLNHKPKIKNIIKSMFPLALFLIFSLIFNFLLKHFGIMQERYNSKLHLLLQKLLHIDKSQIIYSSSLFFTSLTYLGLFLSPVLVFEMKSIKAKKHHVFSVVYASFVMYLLHRYNYILPSLDNIWIDFGVGPFTLYNETAHFKTTPEPNLTKQFYYVLTAFGAYMSSVFFYPFLQNKAKITNHFSTHKTQLFCLVFIIVYLGPFLIVGVYDRYLLPLFPIAIVFVLYNFKPKWNLTLRVFTVGFIVVLTWFSVCATHDYLSWNRARWGIVNYLVKKQQVPLDKINGGAEFITWYHFSETEDEWWQKVKPIYVITADKTPNDNIVNTIEYDRWLPGNGELYLIYNKHLED